jgi:predicted metal-dependent HD superfamily phosphohydrolase
LSNNDSLTQYDAAGAIEYARHFMARNLAPDLTYHNLTHTFEHVMPAAMDLADRSGVSREEKELLAVAVAFHDLGWTAQGTGHERLGAEIARRELPSFGFGKRQIERIVSMIMATQMPHRSTCLLDSIMIDADMAVLGRQDFWEIHDNLRREIESLGKPMTDRQWYKNQLAFLEDHHYFTAAAVSSCEQSKQRHIRQLRHSLEASETESNSERNR